MNHPGHIDFPMKILPRIISLSLSLSSALQADVKLPSIISDHMVLKRAANVPIWGKASPGEKVTVTWDGRSSSTRAEGDGKWKILLNLKNSAAGPFTMTVEEKNTLTVSDILVGEVWIASGQSNMQFALNDALDGKEEVPASGNPLLREFAVQKLAARLPLDEMVGKWVLATPKTTGAFSAVGYFFAKRLQMDLSVPVGMISTNYGGTCSEAWTSNDAIDRVPDLKASRDLLWTAHSDYEKNKRTFVDAMTQWIKEQAREDKAMDAAPFAGENAATEGWIPVTIPGVVKAPGLPDAGAVWLRKEINIPVGNKTNLPLLLPLDGYDSVYWNGKLLKQVTYKTYPGEGQTHRYGPYDIPSTEIREGNNILAIRFYQPVCPATFRSGGTAGSTSLAGGWLAKVESEFPAIEARILATAPLPPAISPETKGIAGSLFNGMIHPLIPYAISGVIWYQGENNAVRAAQYRSSFPLLINDWRKQWNQGDFPFYFCQLANFYPKTTQPAESAWAELREAQSMALKLPNTGQAVLIDLGEANDIHPRDKNTAGQRLALVALAKNYGKSNPFSGPTYESMRVANGKVQLSFTRTDEALVARPLPSTYPLQLLAGKTAPLVRNSPQSEIEGFAICGSDHRWVWAEAKITGDKVVVWSAQVRAPVAVRYAWANNPTCNLYNKSGLPASPFRTDNHPLVTLKEKY